MKIQLILMKDRPWYPYRYRSPEVGGIDKKSRHVALQKSSQTSAGNWSAGENRRFVHPNRIDVQHVTVRLTDGAPIAPSFDDIRSSSYPMPVPRRPGNTHTCVMWPESLRQYLPGRCRTSCRYVRQRRRKIRPVKTGHIPDT